MNEPVEIYFVRGTGEAWKRGAPPLGMLANIAFGLDASRAVCIALDYPATIGPIGGGLMSPSLDTTVEIGANALTQLAVDAEMRGRRHMIVSYSLGGLVVEKYLERIAGKNTWPYPELVVNLANPARPEGRSDFRELRGYGLHTKGRLHPGVHEMADPRDLICSAPADSPWRRISDAISPFSFMQGAHFGDANKQLGRRRLVDIRNMFTPAGQERYRIAAEDMIGYFAPAQFGGRHNAYHLNHVPGEKITYTDYSTRLINKHLRRLVA